jgi:pimeloyl-ACP methyl ester carboxylesterase
MDEVSFVLPRSRLTLRGRRAANGQGLPCLCLHGWLDNCASFDSLGEHLPGLDLIAVDLPGHGHSDAMPGAAYHYLDYAICVLELAHTQRWERFNLIGHSMGGALSSLVAGLHPEKVARLVLIDAIGPLPGSPEETRLSVARYVQAYLDKAEQPVYRSRLQALKARVQLADILLDTAEQLIERDLREVQGGYSWRSDVRLKHPFMRTFSEEQILAFLSNIQAPTLLIQAERTMLKEPFYRRRISSVRTLRVVTLPGGHHLHMENVEPVAETIRAFLAGSSEVLD